jgi:hypothetical protein
MHAKAAADHALQPHLRFTHVWRRVCKYPLHHLLADLRAQVGRQRLVILVQPILHAGSTHKK